MPGERQRRARHPRRGPLGAGVPAAACRSRRASRWPAWPTTRSTTTSWTGLPLLPHRRPAAARAAPAVDRGDAEPGRHRGPGAPGCSRRTTRRSPAGCLAAARTAWAAALANPADLRAGRGRHRRRRLRRRRRHRRVLLGRGRAVHHHRREAVTPTRSLASPLHTADVFRADGFDWSATARARPARPGHRAQRLPDRARGAGSRCVAGADKYLPTLRGQPVRHAVRPGQRALRLGLQQPGRSTTWWWWPPRTTSPATTEVPRRRAARAWTTCSAATRSTSPT